MCSLLAANQRASQHGADVGIAMMQFDDATRDKAAIIENFRCVFVFNQGCDRYRPRGGTQRRANRRHEGIDTALNVVMRVGPENQTGSIRFARMERGLFAHAIIRGQDAMVSKDEHCRSGKEL